MRFFPTRQRGARSHSAWPIMPPPIPVSPGSKTECLPWKCYVLRGALDADAQIEVLERVGKLAGEGFSTWPTRASSQYHPMIVTSHSANASRSRECRRACGLAKCMGYCGRHVGALIERPEDMYGLADDVAAKIARDLGETGFAMDFFSSDWGEPARDGEARRGDGASGKRPASSDVGTKTRFQATHFWGLVYGGRDPARAGKDSEEARGATVVPREEEESNNVTFGGEPLKSSSSSASRRRSELSVEASSSHDEWLDAPNAGRMASHLDRPVGWTLSVSVGEPVAFALGRPPAPDAAMYGDFAAAKADAEPEQKPPGVTVVVRSGDALLFRGHAVFHAVDGFVEEGDEDAFGRAALDEKPGAAWRERLLAPAREAPRAGWKPKRLALLFRHEVDAARGA